MRHSLTVLLVAAAALVFLATRPGRSLQNAAPAAGPVRALTLVFGAKDAEPTRWDGSLSLSAGTIVKLRGHHFTDKDSLGSGNAWQAATTAWPEARGGLHPHSMPDPYATRVMTIGVTVYYEAPDDALLHVKTTPGEFEFRLKDVPESAPLEMMASRVQVYRVPAVEQITGPGYEDDYPSVAVDQSGTPWVAWVGYRNLGDEVFLKRAGAEPVKATERPGDLFAAAAAIDGRGRVWVVWSEHQDTDWRLMARSYDGRSWSRIEQLTSGHGNNLFERLAAGPRGDLHLVWQAARGGRSDIFVKSLSGDRWSDEINLSDPRRDARADDWAPAVATDRSGTTWVAWDSYAGGNYNVLLRPVRNGKAGELIHVTSSPRFHTSPSLAVDAQDRLWVAYDEAEENWAKDTGFLLTGGAGIYQSRKIRCAIYSNGKWLEPRADISEVMPPGVRRYVQTPRLVPSEDGRMWVVFRPRTSAMMPQSLWAAGGKWEVLATYYSGDHWSPPVTLPESVGRNEGPFDAAATPDGRLWTAWVTDHRLYGGPNFGHEPQNNDILLASLPAPGAPASPASPELAARAPEPPAALPIEPQEKAQIAALRRYAITAGGKTYKIYRGDMHRHTEISLDGAGDGSLFDVYRYMMDAAGMDWFVDTDHQSGNDQEYTWWRIEKSEDMFYVPGYFVPLFGYERSVGYPNGHRNVVFAHRGVRTLPIEASERRPDGHTGPILFPYLRQNQGISSPHTSATGMGTDWRDNDPDLEPIVEIFQGARVSAEHEGAPLAASKDREDLWAGGYRPKGFVWNAWAKGYKLGVQASSDHASTHTSYACVLATDYTREGILDGMRRRHTYAATRNIIMDFRIEDGAGTHIQGDSFASRSAPQLVVKAFAAGPIDKIEVIRDNQYIHAVPGSGETADFVYKDNSATPGEHYYYIRVQQKDRHMAWSSPIWVKLEP